MTNKEIADILDEMGIILELKGENPFKCRAFRNAARVLGASPEDLASHVSGGTLTRIRGVGKGLAPVITDLVEKGTSPDYDTLRASIPPGLLTLLNVQGLGPKKVRVLYEKLGIDTPGKLREAADSGALDDLEGFGEKSRENIIRGLDLLGRNQGYHLCPEAEKIARLFVEALTGLRGVSACTVAGSIRRKSPLVGDIDILAGAPVSAAGAIMRAFTSHPEVESILSSGRTKSSVLTRLGIQCDLRLVSPREFPFALSYFTGSKEHNVSLRATANRLGLSLNEYGFTATGKQGTKGRRKIVPRCRSEADIYRALGMDFIAPELRENNGEIEAASFGKLPDLVTLNDLTGTFHCHTTYSDGRNSLKEMVEAARRLKWKYLGIADHSKAAAYAGGLKEKDVYRQLDEIKEINSEISGFTVFSGTEVDILSDGSLDWSDSILSLFDYVVASIHSKFKMTESEATLRIIRAIRNPKVTMLGHPTGRLLLQRDGYPVDMMKVIDAAADHGTIIEINANPRRLDLDWTLCRYAREKGVLISINPDAHSTEGLKDVQHGVNVARKGWLGKKNIFNTKSSRSIAAYIGS